MELFQRSGIFHAASASTSCVAKGGGDGEADTNNIDSASRSQIDGFRAAVDEIRRENPGLTMAAVRHLAIQKMAEVRLRDRQNASVGTAAAARRNSSSMIPLVAAMAMDDFVPYQRRRSSMVGGWRNDHGDQSAGQGHSISLLDHVRKGQNHIAQAINTMRGEHDRDGGSSEPEPPRYLLRRASYRDPMLNVSDKMRDLDVGGDNSDSANSDDVSDNEDNHASESSFRSIRSTRSIEAANRRKGSSSRRSSAKSDHSGRSSKLPPNPPSASSDGAFASSGRRRSVQRRASQATSLCGIREKDDADEDDDCSVPPKEEGLDHGDIVDRSDRSLNLPPGELICKWRRRGSAHSQVSMDSLSCDGIGDDSSGDGDDLICGWASRRSVGSSGSIGDGDFGESPELGGTSKNKEREGGAAAVVVPSSRFPRLLGKKP